MTSKAYASRPQKRVFYGWWVVLATAIIGAWVAGIFFFGFTSFVNPLVKEYGWSYFSISLAISLRSVEGGLLSPVAGFFVDKVGPRKVAFFGGVVAGISYILLSQVNSLAMFYVVFIVLTVGLSCCSTVIMTSAVANWFNRNIGKAMGLATVGFGIGGFLIPIVTRLIDSQGLRTTFVILGIGSLIIIPLCALVLRHKPEQYGYVPDGDKAPEVSSKPVLTSTVPEVEYKPRQILKDRRFWLLSVALALQMMAYNSITVHVLPFFNSALPENTAAVAASFIPAISIPGRLLFGWLNDRFGRKNILVATLALQVIGFALISFMPSLWLIIGFIITFGLGYGGTMATRPAIQREYFGRRSFGTVQGLLVTVMTVGGVIGPMMTGWIVDHQESYQLSWIIFAAVNALAIPLVLMLKSANQNSSSN